MPQLLFNIVTALFFEGPGSHLVLDPPSPSGPEGPDGPQGPPDTHDLDSIGEPDNSAEEAFPPFNFTLITGNTSHM